MEILDFLFFYYYFFKKEEKIVKVGGGPRNLSDKEGLNKRSLKWNHYRIITSDSQLILIIAFPNFSF